MAIFDDLEAEQDRLEKILGGLDGAQWAAPSAAPGWTVADVVLHLAQSEEAVIASAAGAPPRAGSGPRAPGGQNMDGPGRGGEGGPRPSLPRRRPAARGGGDAARRGP